jgi:hypothetical protein
MTPFTETTCLNSRKELGELYDPLVKALTDPCEPVVDVMEVSIVLVGRGFVI